MNRNKTFSIGFIAVLLTGLAVGSLALPSAIGSEFSWPRLAFSVCVGLAVAFAVVRHRSKKTPVDQVN